MDPDINTFNYIYDNLLMIILGFYLIKLLYLNIVELYYWVNNDT